MRVSGWKWTGCNSTGQAADKLGKPGGRASGFGAITTDYTGVMRRLLIKLIGAYQYLISPLIPPACRFTPTCSHYACEAIARHGAGGGVWLSIKRVVRCNPWSPGGYDPVP